MENKYLPTISVLLPTLNAQKVLAGCLQSIKSQNYPSQKIEIIIADGGSIDNTLKIAQKYRIKVLNNPLKTGEAGKAVAFRQAKGELIALIDSDNFLPDKDWFKKMIVPFADKEIVGSEPWTYTYRQKDGFIDRYCALMGMNDPLCYFLGNYDRQNTLSGKWTGLEIEQMDKGDWLKITLKPGSGLPTIGANGTIMRRSVLKRSQLIKDYLVDIDVLADLVFKKKINFAKVKVGIVHLYCGQSMRKFFRKQLRRVRDYIYHQKLGDRKYPWGQHSRQGLLRFILSCLTILPLLYQAVRGFFLKPDAAWLFHPLACWLTLLAYGFGVLEGTVYRREMNRKGWGQ